MGVHAAGGENRSQRICGGFNSRNIHSGDMMKKARKIKVKGVEYKYFLDTAGYKCSPGYDAGRVIILYLPDGTKRTWVRNVPKNITSREVKDAILNGQFENLRV